MNASIICCQEVILSTLRTIDYTGLRFRDIANYMD